MPSDTISSPPSTITSKTGSDTNNGGNFSPLRWQDFFETKRQVSIPSNVDASNITFNVFEINGDKRDAPVILLNHGAGHCALSFAVTAREIRKLVGDQVRIISYDVRGHGETTSDNQSDLALDRLANDLKNLISTLYEHEAVSPEILLVGHSMGGAIVIETATRNLIPNISGVAALDILEGNDN
ncbi:Protein phosphatase methylesterase 1 [Mortierella claussenii]|nr:Protein phosphatase methylesterase 1 [Mortierella claussenii]